VESGQEEWKAVDDRVHEAGTSKEGKKESKIPAGGAKRGQMSLRDEKRRKRYL
jgi:hypothetical protein